MDLHRMHAGSPRVMKPTHRAPPRTGETVSINLGKSLGPARQRGSGFLQGMDGAHPRDKFVAPLGVKFVRDYDPLFSYYGRAKRAGATPELVLSDLWEQSQHAFVGNGYGAPWPGLVSRGAHGKVDWKPFDRFVTDQVAHRAAGKRFEWDVWNESDGGNFWAPKAGNLHPSREGWFLQTWEHAVKDIRKANPHATIVGPSLSSFGHLHGFLPKFLSFAAKHHVLPDAISWHELDPKANPSEITKHVAWVREQIRAYPQIRRIEINEYGDRKNQFSPARTLSYLTALERAKVDAAAHSCWFEFGPHAKDNGTDNSLDGLLDPSGRPRPNYWLYQRYAQLRGTLHDVHASGHVDGLSAADGRGLRMLLANNGRHAFPVSVDLSSLDRVPALAQAHRVHVRVEGISKSGNQGMDPVSGPRKLYDGWVTVSGGRATLPLPAVGPEGVWSVSVEP